MPLLSSRSGNPVEWTERNGDSGGVLEAAGPVTGSEGFAAMVISSAPAIIRETARRGQLLLKTTTSGSVVELREFVSHPLKGTLYSSIQLVHAVSPTEQYACASLLGEPGADGCSAGRDA